MIAKHYFLTIKSFFGIGLILSLSAPISYSFASDGLLTQESELVQGCAACHGVDGNSAVPNFPSLAGQERGFLFHELMNYKNHVRNDDVMSPAVEQLTEEDLAKLAKYFSFQKPVLATPAEVIDPALGAEGKVLYRTERGNPLACSDCHGIHAEGHAATRLTRAFPRIAGQQHDYLVTQLQKYADHKITQGLPGMLRAGHALSENEIKALAAYLANFE